MFDIFNSGPDPIDQQLGSLGMARLVFGCSSEGAWKTDHRTRTNFTTTMYDDRGFIIPPDNRPDDMIGGVDTGETYKMGIRCYEHDGRPWNIRWTHSFIMYGFVSEEYYVPIPDVALSAYSLDDTSTIEVSIESRHDSEAHESASFISEGSVSELREKAPFNAPDAAARVAPVGPRTHPQSETLQDDSTNTSSDSELPARDDLHVIIAAWVRDDDENLDEYAHIINGYPAVEAILEEVETVDEIAGLEIGDSELTEEDANAVKHLLERDRDYLEILTSLSSEETQ